jgi:tetratricopeptide (TPR) repeat protein
MKFYPLLTILFAALFATPADAQTDEISKAKAVITELLQDDCSLWEPDSLTNSYPYKTWPIKKALVRDDRIELVLQEYIMKRNKCIYIDKESFRTVYLLSPFEYSAVYNSLYLDNFLFIKKVSGTNEDIKQLMHNISILRNQIFNAGLALLEPIAAHYRGITEKPPIPEEQRKYIVQANLFNKKKDYLKAIELYIKVIESDQTSYPAAYTNLALLSEQTGNFDTAIYYMKKYLMLEPDAPDARSSQDKIYEWEAQSGK